MTHSFQIVDDKSAKAVVADCYTPVTIDQAFVSKQKLIFVFVNDSTGAYEHSAVCVTLIRKYFLGYHWLSGNTTVNSKDGDMSLRKTTISALEKLYTGTTVKIFELK